MADLPESAKKLIESSALAHLVTLNEDGSPQVSIVWVGLEDGEIVCGHLPRNKKVRNIQRDGRVALSIETDEVSEMGLQQIPGRLRHRPHHRGRRPRAPQQARPDLLRRGLGLPADARPAAGLRHPDQGRPRRRPRPLGRLSYFWTVTRR